MKWPLTLLVASSLTMATLLTADHGGGGREHGGGGESWHGGGHGGRGGGSWHGSGHSDGNGYWHGDYGHSGGYWYGPNYRGGYYPTYNDDYEGEYSDGQYFPAGDYQQTVIQRGLPDFQIDLESDTFTFGQPIQIHLTTRGVAPVTVFWKPDGSDQWVTAPNQTIVFKPEHAGTYILTVVIRDGNGLYSQPKALKITVEGSSNNQNDQQEKVKQPVNKPNQPKQPYAGYYYNAASGFFEEKPGVVPGKLTMQSNPENLSGCYDTTWGILRLVVLGNSVSGNYDYLGGSTLNGQLKGNILIGTWNSPLYNDIEAASGSFQFAFTEEWKTFEGVLGPKGPGPLSKTWNGKRIPCPPSAE